jgi:hypothetical protein
MQRILIAICTLGLATSALADKKKSAGPSQEEMQKMMAEMEKAATPGPEHKALVEGVGNWTATSKMWMEPGKPPTETTGSEEVKSVLGGRFVQLNFKGSFMGKPFEGVGLDGYDNIKKKYVMTWADSMGTTIIYAEGTGDAKQRVYSGEETMPNGQKRSFRWVLKIDSKDKRSMEMFAPGPDGKEAKEMEIVYTRKP